MLSLTPMPLSPFIEGDLVAATPRQGMYSLEQLPLQYVACSNICPLFVLTRTSRKCKMKIAKLILHFSLFLLKLVPVCFEQGMSKLFLEDTNLKFPGKND